MKKIYGFLGAVALMVMASCSNESVFEEDPAGAQTTPDAIGAKGDMFMSVAIKPTGNIGTRTATPGQGKEVGKDYENTISKALVIFAEKDASTDQYKVVTSVFSGTTGTDFEFTGNPQSNYMATFLVNRDALLEDIGGTSKTYSIFVVANANATLAAKFSATSDVQKTFETSDDEYTYWTENEFLMSNASEKTIVITAEAIKKGTHTEATDPFKLGTVQVQRAMSRFDLATASKYTKFTATTEGRDDDLAAANSDLKDITIEFDAVALINMAQKANTFKVTADDKATLGSKTLVFGTEDADNWVFTPDQTAFSTPLFSGLTTGTGGKLEGSTVATGLQGFFTTAAPEASGNKEDYKPVYRVGGYTLISSITDTENQWSEDPTDKPTDVPTYNIWRYCMENTNPDNEENQKNGNSTGVVFRAQITGNTVGGEAIDGTMGALYTYNNVIIGKAETLRTYVINPRSSSDNSGVYDAVKLAYEAAVQEYNKTAETKFTFEEDKTDEGEWTAPEGSELKKGYKDIRKATALELKALDTYLVAKDFSIYRPTSENAEGKYYCYYIYWNRHNDNGDNSQMGPMEFATVRNNVYKLRVNKIHKLGHPGLPEDDPDDPDPDDPDEKDSFYCQVICEILPWEVRLNDIEF